MKKVLFFFILFLLIIFFLWQSVYLPKQPGSEKEVLFLIEKGEVPKDVASNLEKEGLIRWESAFRVYVLLEGASKNLQAGTYLLSPSMNISTIVDKFIEGEVVREEITIIEGWKLRDVAWYFENKGMFQAEELFELDNKDFSEDFNFLGDKPKNLGLEGYLFPDTYQIRRDESLEEIVEKILNNFDKKLTEDLRKEIFRQERTIFEVITMASMLEKEVRTIEDKKLVSGILWKRLEGGIPLQVDATITYITGEKTLQISREDTQIDSPYNTYEYLGLPLGPISNPGLDSIKAAIYSERSDHWYYLSTPEGETIFSETLEEHNIAKARYLQ